jgi:serine/threonine protein phosphatase PrpC
MKFSVFQVSRRGGRAKNEDRMGYCYTPASGLFVLADGMGGHPEGDTAAQLAVETVSALHQQQARPLLAQANNFLSQALLAAHRRIVLYAREKGLRDSPRTTLVAAVVQERSLSWIHCGDSRLYLVRGGQLIARTRDHSYVAQVDRSLARYGQVSRHVLFTCLGSPTRPEFDVVGSVPLQQGDRIVLCSDGLWSSLSDAEIVRQISAAPVAQAVPDMVEQALRKAGERSDNVTVLAIEWELPDPVEADGSPDSDAVDDDFADTIQSSDVATQEPVLDDAAIERSIAEINEAIRQAALRRAAES